MQLADPPIEDPLEFELPVSSPSVTAARRSVGQFADRVGAPRCDVEVAVSEAVSNAVLHAFPDGAAAGAIKVRAELRGGKLEVIVSDDGTGLRPDLDQRGLGLGLPLIAKLSDEYRIQDAPEGGAVVTMRFPVGSEDGR